MEADSLTVELYATKDGKVPFRDWIRSLRSSQVQQRINVRLSYLRLGNWGNWRSVGEGVKELKIDIGPGYRIYCGQQGDKIVIVLCAGDKSSQSEDINQAKVYWNEYKSRLKEKSKANIQPPKK